MTTQKDKDEVTHTHYNPLYYTDELINENSLELYKNNNVFDITNFGIELKNNKYFYKNKYKITNVGFDLISEMINSSSDDILNIKSNIEIYYSLYKQGIKINDIFYIYSHFIDKSVYRYINTWNNLILIHHKGYLDKFINDKNKLIITSVGCNYGTELISIRDFIKKLNDKILIDLISYDKEIKSGEITKNYPRLFFKDFNLEKDVDKNILNCDILLLNKDLFKKINELNPSYVKKFISNEKLIIVVNNKSRYRGDEIDLKYKIYNKYKLNENNYDEKLILFTKI